jgi:hypothetical protein
LAVEALLQAYAIRQGARFDARHDLATWLSKSPLALQDAIYQRARPEWNRLTVVWSNRLRYLSVDGLRAHLRERGLLRIKPSQADALKANCDAFLKAVGEVHGKGMVLWPRNNS